MTRPMKRVIALLMALILLSSAVPFRASAASPKNYYSTDWRKWSQGASGYSAMVDYGCHMVAQSKLMAEAGLLPKGFTPDTWIEWMVANNGVANIHHIEELHASGAKMMEYIQSRGVSVKRIGVSSNGSYIYLGNLSAKDRVAKVWGYIKAGYYVILEYCNGSNHHQVYISRKDSLQKGKPILSNSVHDSKTTALYSYTGRVRSPSVIKAEEGISGWSEGNYIRAYVYQVGPAPATPAAAPTMSSEGFPGGVYATLSSADPGATIYYTTNGSTPTKSSTIYTGRLRLTAATTIKAMAAVSGRPDSDIVSWTVDVKQTPAPTFDVSVSADGFNVAIQAEDGAQIFYETEGETATMASTRYFGAGTIDIANGTTISAIAVKDGMTPSEPVYYTCVAAVPSAPTAQLAPGTSSVLGIGDTVSVTWTKDPNAYGYDYLVLLDDEPYMSDVTDSTVLSFPAEEDGVYTITVRATNFLGSSTTGSQVQVTVKPNVTVSFLDWDDSVISEQSVKYGGNATPPVAQERTGYTFSRWLGVYNNVRTDVTIRASYIANTYTVSFVDEDGNQLATELVDYDCPVQNVPQAPAKLGYTFVGWGVKSGSGDSYTQVNGDVTFAPIYAWTNPDLPLAVSVDQAIRSADATSYSVTVRFVNQSSEPVNGKLITVIKTVNDKLVAAEIDYVTVPANADNFTQTVLVGGTAVGSVAEAYVVANDSENDNRTGGAYSEGASCPVTMESSEGYWLWGDWSEWAEQTPPEGADVEEKTQYRYRDLETTTSTEPSLSGWGAPVGSYVEYGEWGAWSGWSLTAQTPSDTKAVETRTVYVYRHYCDGNGNIAPSTSYTYGVYGPHTLYYTSKQKVSRTSSTGYTITDGLTKCAKGASSYYYWGTATQYRYRTRSATTIYNYQRWGEWSDWDDAPVSASNTRQCETRTVCRYRVLEYVENTFTEPYLGAEDLSGTYYTVSGELSGLAQDYSGKTAAILVYKDKNVDPTEDQIEYVGSTVLGENNFYSFGFIPKEEISLETGNYVVSFGIATADGLVNNVEIIPAPKPVYTVVFKDVSGSILSSQSVTQGSDAVAPPLPELEGYDVSWNRSFTDVSKNLIVTAVATPRTYTVIFVDWANSAIVQIDELLYGSEIVFPGPRSAEGKTFVGWSLPAGSIVNGTTVVEAVYEDLRFTVSFLNMDGSVFSTAEVSYGGEAAIPEGIPSAEGYTFLAWNYANKWWNVTEDVSIAPIFIYAETAEAPVREDSDDGYSDSDLFFDDAEIVLNSSTDGAVIYYTLDGTDPLENGLLYTEPVLLTETATIRAASCMGAMNDSPIAEFHVEILREEDLPTVTILTEHAQFQIGETSFSLPVRLENPNGDILLSYGFVVLDENGDTSTYEVDASEANQTAPVVGRLLSNSNLSADQLYSVMAFGRYQTAGIIGSEELEFITGEGVHVHDWLAPEYCWSADFSEVSAIRSCSRYASHMETEYVSTSSVVVQEPTVDEEGEIVYTAVFENPAFETQTRTVPIPKLIQLPCSGDSHCPGNAFTDMPAYGTWAHEPIDWAIANGVTAGTSATTFSPSRTANRAQVMTFLWRALGSPEAEPCSLSFTDVPYGAYYFDAVLWAAGQGITAGATEELFGASQPCTRAQVITFLWRAAGSPEPESSQTVFADIAPTDYYYQAVLWAAEQGITSGTSHTSFSPNQRCTRAQIVTFLYHYATQD